jgi:uncharacterized protein (DUF2235 family)
VKNIVLVFDRTREHPGRRDATNAETLFRLLDKDGQIVWYHIGTRTPLLARGVKAALRWREAAIADARAGIAEAYAYLIDTWEPGDRIFMFGVGPGAFCARELARLLGTIGLMQAHRDDLVNYVLATYALPRTRRTPQDWRRVTRLTAKLSGQREIAVPVQFLGLWDTVKVPGSRSTKADPLPNVVAGRHAVAIDGGNGPFAEHLVASEDERIEEVWFRGAHCDIAGGAGACWPLADITLDWILDGARRAGALVRAESRYEPPTPTELDALTEGARTISFRSLPANALVHGSVDIYVRAHPEYWRRLPGQVIWADTDWLARSERLVRAADPVAARERDALVAAAS